MKKKLLHYTLEVTANESAMKIKTSFDRSIYLWPRVNPGLTSFLTPAPPLDHGKLRTLCIIKYSLLVMGWASAPSGSKRRRDPSERKMRFNSVPFVLIVFRVKSVTYYLLINRTNGEE